MDYYYILADCVGTTSILIMGPMFVGCVSAKLSTLKSFSLAMFRKFSFRLRSAGESNNTWTTTHDGNVTISVEHGVGP